MSGLNLQTPCPSCQKPMTAHGLRCSCGVEVAGPVQVNEFAALEQGQLQFLRMFVLMEGRITDLEKALGISYPTVKSRIRDLKNALHLGEDHLDDTAGDGLEDDPSVDKRPESERPENGRQQAIGELLDELESGGLSAEEMLSRLKDPKS